MVTDVLEFKVRQRTVQCAIVFKCISYLMKHVTKKCNEKANKHLIPNCRKIGRTK